MRMPFTIHAHCMEMRNANDVEKIESRETFFILIFNSKMKRWKNYHENCTMATALHIAQQQLAQWDIHFSIGDNWIFHFMIIFFTLHSSTHQNSNNTKRELRNNTRNETTCDIPSFTPCFKRLIRFSRLFSFSFCIFFYFVFSHLKHRFVRNQIFMWALGDIVNEK
jgi:hypothetical protein